MKWSFSSLLSLVPGAVSAIALVIIYMSPSAMSLLLVTLVWWGLLVWSHVFFKLNRSHVFLQLLTSFAFIALLSLVEGTLMAAFLIALSAIAFSFIWRWVTEVSRQTTGLQYKTWRRIIMMLWVFNVYAITTVLFSIPVFFQGTPRILMILLAGVCAAAVALMIWHTYFQTELYTFLLWGAVLAVVIMEAMWALFYLPLGYFGLGLLLTWIWYLLQLFIRFHLTKGGILWERQKMFLTVNAVAFASVLFLVRWV